MFVGGGGILSETLHFQNIVHLYGHTYQLLMLLAPAANCTELIIPRKATKRGVQYLYLLKQQNYLYLYLHLLGLLVTTGNSFKCIGIAEKVKVKTFAWHSSKATVTLVDLGRGNIRLQ